MPSGGARARSGPAPDENALRRFRKDDEKTWVDLDPAGYRGKIPENPLHESDFGDPEAPVNAEAEMWNKLWRRPQAAMWKKLGLEYTVAMYVRKFLEASKPEVPSGIVTAVIRMEGELGISTVGMRSLRWRLKSDELEERRDEKTTAKKNTSARSRRLKAVSDDG